MFFKQNLTQTEQTICAMLAGAPVVPEADLFDVAVENEVDTELALLLAEQDGWDAVPAEWRQNYEAVDARISSYLVELDRVAEQLTAIGIPLIALKNSGIIRGIYQHAGCVPMGDVDVLVQKKHFRRAHKVMLENGFNFEFRSELEEAEIDEAEQGGGAEYWKKLPNGEKLWFELQWRAVAGRWIRPDQEPPADELMARSLPIAGTAVRLLSPEDNLLQVALHTAKHSFVRAPGFRLHLDVERIVRLQEIDWAVFLARVNKLQVKTAVYTSLLIPQELFGTPIPDHVLTALQPSTWKRNALIRWINKAGLFSPNEKKFGNVEFIFFSACLYDDPLGLVRGIFPDFAWMRDHYKINNDWLLPFYYLRRIGNLAFRRAI